MANGYYRLNKRKRVSPKKIIIIVFAVILVLAMLFILVGNLLNKKTKDDGTQNGETEQTVNEQISSKLPYSVNAYAVDLALNDLSAVSTKANDLRSNGATAISVNLSDDKGNLFFKSDIAEKFGNQLSSSTLPSVSDIFSRVTSKNVLGCGYISLSFEKEEDPKVRMVKRAYDAALVAEISEGGFTDVTLRCGYVDLDVCEELVSLSESISVTGDSIHVGTALPENVLKAGDLSLFLDKLTSAYDFLALDLVSESGGPDFISHIEELLEDPNLRYCLIRYNIRLLIPEITDEEDLERIKDIFRINSVSSWQMVK